jgi:hypothetical protein
MANRSRARHQVEHLPERKRVQQWVEARRSNLLDADTGPATRTVWRMIEIKMASDPTKAAIGAMADILRRWLGLNDYQATIIAQAQFASQHGIVRVVPIEATEEMDAALGGVDGAEEVSLRLSKAIYAAMTAAGDLTKRKL